ncbi:MAG: GAF domain-containing protein [bacterium]|nr:GAF domain-containing protein [bacterium]
MADRDLQAHLDHLIRIGIALSSQLDIDELLEMIVDESRRFTRADAGTLYLVTSEERALQWKIVQNDTMGTRIGGTSAVEIDEKLFKPVPLYVDGQVNMSNVSAYVAHTGETVNIPDVYEAVGFDFTGPRLYDQATGYRSRSMLVAPLRNHEDDIIGVLQLLNAWDEEHQEVVPFSPEFEGLIASLASQAAVGVTNAQLVQDLQNLFDAFIQATAAAIDEKSPYTAGHVRRVADLTMMIAQEINEADQGLWRRLRFTDEELNALRISAWMHDVGKITTPEYVVDKATKLETISDRIGAVRTRYEVLRREAEVSALKQKIALLERGEVRPEPLRAIERELETELEALRDELMFIEQCNTGGEFMADEDIARLEKIAQETCEVNGEVVGRLTKDELYNLSIRKGTLTNEERQVINNHAAVSIKMLSQLPFSKALRRVPEYAGGHHEKLNGKGYPRGLTAEQLPLQARILAVADVFEALTAPDRPYRKPMSLSQALKIIGFMVKDGELDGRIVELFLGSGLVMQYARKELDEAQIDVSA